MGLPMDVLNSVGVLRMEKPAADSDAAKGRQRHSCDVDPQAAEERQQHGHGVDPRAEGTALECCRE